MFKELNCGDHFFYKGEQFIKLKPFYTFPMRELINAVNTHNGKICYFSANAKIQKSTGDAD